MNCATRCYLYFLFFHAFYFYSYLRQIILIYIIVRCFSSLYILLWPDLKDILTTALTQKQTRMHTARSRNHFGVFACAIIAPMQCAILICLNSNWYFSCCYMFLLYDSSCFGEKIKITAKKYFDFYKELCLNVSSLLIIKLVMHNFIS